MSHACSTSLITLVIRPLLLAFMNNSSIFYALDLWIQHACIHFCKRCTVHIYISHVAMNRILVTVIMTCSQYKMIFMWGHKSVLVSHSSLE